ncbi:unnamed protein product [Rotaria sordida]|uniref:Uncharacterized protein n=1 Tax=Rotaria sordida TaxID=392033 RepID=A0A814QRN7_9BILA|nr:unnamed protein product [Rotaria sordida]CAF1535769.1 unnamed protein product [Rotaria sordida]
MGGITKIFETLTAGNRLQFSVMTLDPSVRYTFWSILFGKTFFDTALCACLQTHAQRYMCVKDIKAAQRAAWIYYVMTVMIIILCTCVGCLLYAKYSQCDPLRAKLISKPDQFYPLFVIQILGQFPGLTGLFIVSVLSASLSTISSGVNSMAAVILEDIYKRLPITRPISNKSQATVSKLLSVGIGLLTIFLAFIVSYMKNNIITIVLQIFDAFATPILDVYLLGFFAPRVQSRSVLIAFLLCLIFQMWVLVGATVTVKPHLRQRGRLPTSIVGCIPSVNMSVSTSINERPNPLTSLFSISPLWYSFNGVFITFILGLIFASIFESKDSRPVDRSLLISPSEIFPFCSSKPVSIIITYLV